MALPPASPALLILVANAETRDFLVTFLEGHEYVPRVGGNLAEVVQILKGLTRVTVFVDCQTVSTYGPGLYAKMKVACPQCRLVLLCDKSHEDLRELVKEAMELGVYACLQAPFAEWEVLAMVRPTQATKSPGRRPSRPREKP